MGMLPQPIFSSAFVRIITIFSILLLLPPSYSDNDNTSENCHPLEFPWRNCEKDVPTIDVKPDGSFLLRPANPSDYPLTIASMNFEAFICPETPQNILLLPLLKFSETNKNLTLFYNCNSDPDELLTRNTTADCEPNDNNTAFHMNASELKRYNHSKCNTVEVTVNQAVFTEVQKGELTLLTAWGVWFHGVFNSSAFLCHKWEMLDEICRSLVRPPAPDPGMDYLCKTICFQFGVALTA
ncbi:hypothetical protein SLEP1_g50558 [Rubroshorea leprosula]|uniref:Uncharacterized protein n=1 Tax=Rubroshorea leprosula TaxID=152421 RepID=A0AAV5M1C2_9ROSI|nr:hypothetical protein SLEP1_g50558 [Rubroshorea leprosula]